MKPLQKGDLFSIVSDREYTAKIILLDAYHISIKLQSPFGSRIGRSIPRESLNKSCYAVKTDDEYVTTDTGFQVAFMMLVKIARDECRLLKNPLVIQSMLAEYYQKKAEKHITEKDIYSKADRWQNDAKMAILLELKEKYFPNLTTIVFDEDLMENLEKYLSEHEGLSIPKTITQQQI